MKRITVLILLLLSVLVSCTHYVGDEADTSSTYNSDKSTNQFIYYASWHGRLIHYDVETRRASVACPDPLCTHQKKDPRDISYDPDECLAVNVSFSPVPVTGSIL